MNEDWNFDSPLDTMCEWNQDIDSVWNTECGEVYLEDNVMDIKHCPFCGDLIHITNEEYNEYNND